MRRSADAYVRFAVWMLVSFIVGIVTGMLFLVGGRGHERVERAAPEAVLVHPAERVDSGKTPDPTTSVDSARTIDGAKVADGAKATDVQPVRNPPPASSAPPPDIDEAIDDLRGRDLKVPVKGVSRDDLRDSFKEARDRIREHEAVDILAPRRTPVLAVEDGTIVKFFSSVRGGLTIYQFDPSQTYAYYYAHLDGYAPGLSEGHHVERGQTIGFVGSTGNAPATTPHLHVQIFLLTEKKQWWKGTAINPYDVWKK